MKLSIQKHVNKLMNNCLKPVDNNNEMKYNKIKQQYETEGRNNMAYH